jgi:phosphoribosylanthranilate isomerase
MASAVNNLTDARYFAARGVEWLSFRLGDAPDGISLLAAKAIAEWVDGVKIVGEFDFATALQILEANQSMHFDAVQVGMFTPVNELEKLSNLTLIKEVVVEKNTTAVELMGHYEANAQSCAYFLLDFTKSGTDWAALQAGELLTVEFLNNLFHKKNTILSLDFQPSETQRVLDALRPFAFSLTGGEEEKIGLKSFDELDEILDQLELAG